MQYFLKVFMLASSYLVNFVTSNSELNFLYEIPHFEPGLILMYKIIQWFIGIDMSIFTFRDTHPTTRGHQYKVFKYPVHYNARAIFPAELLTCGITYHQILSKHNH